MNVHRLTTAPSPELAKALTRFEEQFTYPLGPGRFFRISHGDDYPRFFRAIGDAVCFVAERDGEVLGVLGLAATRVRIADGTERSAIYLGDLKVAPAARCGMALLRLAEAAGAWCVSLAECGFGVVMDGTPVTPDRYTGRLGIPHFREVAKIAVLKLPALVGSDAFITWEANAATGEECFTRLTAGHISTAGGNALERSDTSPLWLVSPDGSACGRFEDTRRAKRLFADDGSEIISAHLSCIGYANHSALAELLRVACSVAAVRGFPALFAAVPMAESDAILAALNKPGVIVAPATVFATNFQPNQLWFHQPWSINTAEI
ncbi:MAG: N-acetyltransferase [Planctomycetia bacterium]|nr:N-acetyltransferase [Planctomycetia bacterium]